MVTSTRSLTSGPAFSAAHDGPYSGDVAQIVIAAVCRLLSAHDAKWNVAGATGCRARLGGLSGRLVRALQRDNAQEQGCNHDQDAQTEHDDVAVRQVGDGAPEEGREG